MHSRTIAITTPDRRTRPVTFAPDGQGGWVSDAVLAVTRGKGGQTVYPVAIHLPGTEGDHARVSLLARHLADFRGLTANVVGWADRPELGWRGDVPPTAESCWWERDALAEMSWAEIAAAIRAGEPTPGTRSRIDTTTGLRIVLEVGRSFGHCRRLDAAEAFCTWLEGPGGSSLGLPAREVIVEARPAAVLGRGLVGRFMVRRGSRFFGDIRVLVALGADPGENDEDWEARLATIPHELTWRFEDRRAR